MLKSDLDKIRKDFNAKTQGKGKYLKIEAGSETNLRILGPTKGAEGFFYYMLGSHFNVSIGGETRAVSCTESVGKGPCVMCSFVAKLRNSDRKIHDKLAQRIRRNIYYYMNVLNKEDDKIYIFRAPKRLIDRIWSIKDKRGIDVTDFNKGLDLTIIRNDATKWNDVRYKYRFAKAPSKVAYKSTDLFELQEIVPTWLDKKIIFGIMVENFGDTMRELGMSTKYKSHDEEDDGEVRTIRKKKKKKVTKIVEEIDDDDDDIDIDDLEIEEDED